MTSDNLSRWVDETNKKNSQRRGMYSLVFGYGAVPYFFFRTRLQLINLLIRFSLHALEYALILHTIPEFLLPAMILRVVLISIESGWWGVLDPTRQRIRNLSEKGDLKSVREEVYLWLAIIKKIVLLIILLAIVVIICLSENLYQAVLILAMFTGLSVRLILRTLYSAAYAVRRVYVRFEWVVISEFFIFLLAWAAKPYLGQWTMPLSVITATILSSMISYYYIRSSLSFMRIMPSLFDKPKVIKDSHIGNQFKNYQFKQFLRPAIAMILTRLHDILLIGLLVWKDNGSDIYQILFTMVYLVVPIIRAALGWAQSLYFDLVQNQLDSFNSLRKYYEEQGLRYSLLYGFFVSAVTFISLYLIWPSNHEAILMLSLYILLLSPLGFIHVVLFSTQRFMILTFLCTFQYLLTVMVLTISNFSFWYLLMCLLIPLMIGIYIVKNIKVSSNQNDNRYLQWVRHVSDYNSQISILVIELVEDTTRGFRRMFIDRIRPIIGHNESTAFFNRLFLSTLPNSFVLTDNNKTELIIAGSGYIRRINHYKENNGLNMLQSLYSRYSLMGVGKKDSVFELKERFLSIFPSGYVQLPTVRDNEIIKKLNIDEMNEIVRLALLYAQGNKINSDSNWFVTTYQKEGLIKAIFIIKKHFVNGKNKTEWKSFLQSC
jgi:hypothetical protein